MKVKDQTQEPMRKVAELIGDMRVCMMTSLKDRRLESRPMTPLVLEEDGVLWFLANGSSMQGVDMESINIAFSNESDASYVAMEGPVQIVDDRARKEDLWTAYAKPWYPDGPDTPDLVALKFMPRSVDSWDSPSSKVVRLFAMAASIAAAKPIGLGEHEQAQVSGAR